MLLTLCTTALLAGGTASAGAGAGKPAGAEVTLNWVGDIALSTQAGLPARPDRTLFAPVEPYLRRADLTLGNLEGTLSSGGTSKCARRIRLAAARPRRLRDAAACFAFQAPPGYAAVLRRAGFDVLNMANNHSNDFGVDGRRSTLAALGRAHLAHTGLPGEITVERVRGVRLAVLGFAPYANTSNLLDVRGARRLVARARRRAPLVVVIIHAGAEGAAALHTPRGTEYAFGEDRGSARAFAHAVIGAGASLVIGSGPHVVRGLECSRHRLIAYSLGNFIGYRTLATSGVLALSGILHVTLDPTRGAVAARWYPLRLVPPGVPRHDRSGESTRLVGRLSHEDFGASGCGVARKGAVRVR